MNIRMKTSENGRVEEVNLFHEWGFTILISTLDKFTLIAKSGILFLKVCKPNGTSITQRVRIVSDTFESFDFNKLSHKDQRSLILNLKYSEDMRNVDIANLVGTTSTNISNHLRSKG